MIEIDYCNHTDRPVVAERLCRGVRCVLAAAGIERAAISLAVVDDPAIHQLNRRFLSHDYPTDVLSFSSTSPAGELEGEVIVSLDTAEAEAQRYAWPAADELLLYVIHGTLHLVGYEDQTDEGRRRMREAERRRLADFGVAPPSDHRAAVTGGRPGRDS